MSPLRFLVLLRAVWTSELLAGWFPFWDVWIVWTDLCVHIKSNRGYLSRPSSWAPQVWIICLDRNMYLGCNDGSVYRLCYQVHSSWNEKTSGSNQLVWKIQNKLLLSTWIVGLLFHRLLSWVFKPWENLKTFTGSFAARYAEPGSIMAIMGPSGSGKSCLSIVSAVLEINLFTQFEVYHNQFCTQLCICSSCRAAGSQCITDRWYNAQWSEQGHTLLWHRGMYASPNA